MPKMKLKIEETLPLRLYYFSVTPRSAKQVDIHEKIELAVSYRMEEAFECIEDMYRDTIDTVFIKNQGSVDVESIMELAEKKLPTLEIIVEEPKKEENIKSYLFNLMLVKDKFNKVLNDTDKVDLERIVKKIDIHLHKSKKTYAKNNRKKIT